MTSTLTSEWCSPKFIARCTLKKKKNLLCPKEQKFPCNLLIDFMLFSLALNNENCNFQRLNVLRFTWNIKLPNTCSFVFFLTISIKIKLKKWGFVHFFKFNSLKNSLMRSKTCLINISLIWVFLAVWYSFHLYSFLSFLFFSFSPVFYFWTHWHKSGHKWYILKKKKKLYLSFWSSWSVYPWNHAKFY